ncbi:unnamed protein product, partial [marine sediment metagenome]
MSKNAPNPFASFIDKGKTIHTARHRIINCTKSVTITDHCPPRIEYARVIKPVSQIICDMEKYPPESAAVRKIAVANILRELSIILRGKPVHTKTC